MVFLAAKRSGVSMSKKLLIIDDDATIVQSLKYFLDDESDFSSITAGNGKEGLALIEAHNPDAVIVDLHMPIMDGYEFIKQAKAVHPDLPIIIMSAEGMIDKAMEAIRAGGCDFVSKPVLDMRVLLHTVEQCLYKANLIKENQRYQHHLEELVVERTNELQQTKKQILNCLGKAAEFKDSQTGAHVCRVAEMSFLVARGLGLDKLFCETIRDAAPMHDVGKIGIHDDVLLKNGRLDGQEWEHMKEHVRIGCTILCSGDDGNVNQTCFEELLLDQKRDVSILTVAKRIALFHHERWDGKGYPFGLAEELIPIEARIVGMVDVYDAMSSRRPYKQPFAEDHCQDVIRKGAGQEFDPAVVEAFFNNLNGILAIKNKFAKE